MHKDSLPSPGVSGSARGKPRVTIPSLKLPTKDNPKIDTKEAWSPSDDSLPTSLPSSARSLPDSSRSGGIPSSARSALSVGSARGSSGRTPSSCESRPSSARRPGESPKLKITKKRSVDVTHSETDQWRTKCLKLQKQLEESSDTRVARLEYENKTLRDKLKKTQEVADYMRSRDKLFSHVPPDGKLYFTRDHMQGNFIPNNLKFPEPKPAPKPQAKASSKATSSGSLVGYAGPGLCHPLRQVNRDKLAEAEERNKDLVLQLAKTERLMRELKRQQLQSQATKGRVTPGRTSRDLGSPTPKGLNTPRGGTSTPRESPGVSPPGSGHSPKGDHAMEELHKTNSELRVRLAVHELTAKERSGLRLRESSKKVCNLP